tara:strand:+ start:1050 stop:1229 length:180 start_codon:yes stop_codon:yes gene_type:complete
MKYKSIHLFDPDDVIPKKYVQINNTAIPKYDRYPMENQYLIFINEKNIIITVKTVNFIK